MNPAPVHYKHALHKTALFLAVVLLAVACAPSVMANTVYTYTGSPYTQCYGTYVATCSTISLSGTLDLSLSLSQLENLSIDTPLPASDIVSLSFSDGFGESLSLADSVYSLVAIGTNSQGQITDWYVMLISGLPAANTTANEGLIYLIGGVGENTGGFSGNQVQFTCGAVNTFPKGCKEENIVDGGDELGSGSWSLPQTGTTAPTPEPPYIFVSLPVLVGLILFGRRCLPLSQV